jgi:NAD(P)-dependent dehydrogenase (short-subunit alcohol dehydrogenase family)
MFEGRVALITGAANGIGRAVALMMKARGARAVIAADKDSEGLAEISPLLGEDGIHLDVTDRAEMKAAATQIEEKYGAIDILVVAAGILQPPPPSLEAVSERQFDRIIDVNLKGAWNAVTLVGTGMVRRGSGSIVTIASTTGMIAGPLVPYGPAKAALIEMTKSFAGAWGEAGLRVNCVAPGFVETDALVRGASFGILNMERLAAETALKRLATTEEVAQTICFLASQQASGITGAVVPVDCGARVAPGFAALERPS